MSDQTTENVSQETLQEILAETDSAARHPEGLISQKILFFVPLAWTLFQLWYASPLPFTLNIFIFNSSQARAIHLAFAMFLVYTAYPCFRSSPSSYIPVQDWVFAFIASFCAGYLFLFYEQISLRPGDPTNMDIIVSLAGIILLLEATRRALGPPLMIVASVFLFYTFGGSFMPDVIAHKGASLSKGMYHYWLSTEGVYGVALGVSTGMVFMFVLFGSLLESAGAGNYFIRSAFAALGHMRGGPAKAAVVSSGMTGLVSGSSIANVVTTGTFTIPLMKKVGFSAEKAGAVEVAASTNGQLTPPVMGAAAFLMVEYVGISYIDVIKHAFLPAIISYIALVYIVHLEACKMGLTGMERRKKKTFSQTLLSFVTGFIFVLFIAAGTYYGLGWIKEIGGSTTIYIIGMLLAAAYVFLVWFACQVPELPNTHEITQIPDLKSTAQAGYYFLLPIVVLMWCLTVERLSPALSAFWATILLLFIVLTQRPLKGFFRKQHTKEFSFALGWEDLIQGLVSGAKGMIGIGVATAAAGIVVGTVTLTGIGLVMTEFVELISGGNLMLILLFTAMISLILGMGLPTTANYIVVSTLMAPVIVELGAQNGLVVPLVAVHLFVFYFGILADDTPPVGLAAFAASGISGGDPIRTGIQGFTYDIRTAILPFMFIFNTELLMIGIYSWAHLAMVVVTAVIAMLVFSAATQGYWMTKNRFYESLLMLLIAFSLFRPGFFWDRFFPPFEVRPGVEILQVANDLPSGSMLCLHIAGEDINANAYTKTLMLPLGEKKEGKKRLADIGFALRKEENKMIVDVVEFASTAEKMGIDFDQEIVSVSIKSHRPPKQLIFIPAMGLLFLIYLAQKKRKQTN